MANKDSTPKSEDIIRRLSKKTVFKEELFDDPTCVDGAQSDDDDDDDDEGGNLDWALRAPTIEVIGEVIMCRKGKSWINLLTQYIGYDSEDIEYEFVIEEIEESELPAGAIVLGNPD
jgi:hypothetical protein